MESDGGGSGGGAVEGAVTHLRFSRPVSRASAILSSIAGAGLRAAVESGPVDLRSKPRLQVSEPRLEMHNHIGASKNQSAAPRRAGLHESPPRRCDQPCWSFHTPRF